MKSSRSSIQHDVFTAAKFRCRQPDNLIRVENTRLGGVLVCAARDNFDSAHRRTFLLYLKAEGFVPGHVRLVAGHSQADHVPMPGQVAWVFDPSWPYADVRFNHYTRRLCGRLLLGPTVAWLLFMWLATFH